MCLLLPPLSSSDDVDDDDDDVDDVDDESSDGKLLELPNGEIRSLSWDGVRWRMAVDVQA